MAQLVAFAKIRQRGWETHFPILTQMPATTVLDILLDIHLISKFMRQA